MRLNRFLINMSAFLSGCFPVALIEWIRVIIFRPTDNNWYVEIFFKTFLGLSILCIISFLLFIFYRFKKANTPCVISKLRRKDTFSSGAISYYILPFISFLGNDMDSMLTLLVIIIFLMVIFHNNMMFMYTPVLDFMGYKVLEGELSCRGESPVKVVILVKSDNGIIFTGENHGKVKKVQDGLFFFVTN